MTSVDERDYRTVCVPGMRETLAGSGTTKYPLDDRPPTYWAGDIARRANIRRQVERVLELGAEGQGCTHRPFGRMMRHLNASMEGTLGYAGWAAGMNLPDYRRGEVEIARIAYTCTVHMEVSAVRARPCADGRIRYRVVTEIEFTGDEEPPLICRPASSREPLPMGRIIDLIDSVHGISEDPYPGMVLGDLALRLARCGGPPSRYRDFIAVSSLFYPHLGRWYQDATEAWIAWREHEPMEEVPQ